MDSCILKGWIFVVGELYQKAEEEGKGEMGEGKRGRETTGQGQRSEILLG